MPIKFISGVAAIIAIPMISNAAKAVHVVHMSAPTQLINFTAGGSNVGRLHHDSFILVSESNPDTKLKAQIAAYREDLKKHTREHEPMKWAEIQNELGNALLSLGENEAGTARFEEAISAFREALKEHTRERAPLDWAQNQNDLGAALANFGEREKNITHLEEAVATFHEALKERTHSRVPDDWAITQMNLAAALTSLGELQGGTAQLKEAVQILRDISLEILRKHPWPDWAISQYNLGRVLTMIGDREKNITPLKEAITPFRAAIGIAEKVNAKRNAEEWKQNLAKAELLIAKLNEQSGK